MDLGGLPHGPNQRNFPLEDAFPWQVGPGGLAGLQAGREERLQSLLQIWHQVETHGPGRLLIRDFHVRLANRGSAPPTGREDIKVLFESIATAVHLIELHAEFAIGDAELAETVLNTVKWNESLHVLSGLKAPLWLEAALQPKHHCLKLNRQGRKNLATEGLGFWPTVLERSDADVIYCFLLIKPGLLR